MSLKDKIIAFDLDGTLVRNDAFPSEYTCKKISELVEKGYKITLLTGRAPISSRAIYESCHMNIVSSHNNGALVYDFATKTKIINKTIPMDIVSKIVDNEELMSHIDDIKVEIDDNIYGMFGKNSWNKNEIVGDFRKTLPEEPNSLIVCAKSREDQPFIYDIINSMPFDYHYRYWWLTGEFYNYKFSKKEGAEEILKYYGKTKEDLVFFGDAENDIEALEYAGIGVAMKNASDDVKKHANQVTEYSNDEDGAVKHLLKMIEEDK